MIDRVSGDTAINRANATMARTPGFAENHVLVLDVPHLAESGVAIFMDPSDLTGWKANLGVAFISRHEHRSGSGGANHLAAFAGVQLNIMNRQANGDGSERQAIADLGRSRGAAHQLS